jgi:hypothetical protein
MVRDFTHTQYQYHQCLIESATDFTIKHFCAYRLLDNGISKPSLILVMNSHFNAVNDEDQYIATIAPTSALWGCSIVQTTQLF